MNLRVCLLFAALALPAPTLSHGNEEHVRGVVKSKDGSLLVVTTSTGEDRVETDANTRFDEAGKPATAKDARVGQRVVIHASRHDGALRATRVQLGSMETDAGKGQEP